MNSVKITPYVRIAKNNATYVFPKMRNLLPYFYFIRPANSWQGDCNRVKPITAGPCLDFSIKSFVGFNMAQDEGRSLATSSLGRPPLGLKRLAPLAKRSTCGESSPCLTVPWLPPLRHKKVDYPTGAVVCLRKLSSWRMVYDWLKYLSPLVNKSEVGQTSPD